MGVLTRILEPSEFKSLKKDVVNAWKSIEKMDFARPSSEKANIKFKRSLYYVKEIAAGEVIDETCIRCVRPGFGLSPKFLDKVKGSRLKVDVGYGDSVQWEHFE